MRGLKKVRFLLIGFLMLFVICLTLSGCSWAKEDTYNIKEYEDADTVLSVFDENADEFEEVVTILNNQQLNDYIFDKFMLGELGGYSFDDHTLKAIKDTDYLTEEEYTTVTDFFKKYAPYTIRKERTEGDWFDFHFIAKDRNISLYYIGTEDDAIRKRTLYDIGQNEEVFFIQDNWYYGLGEPHNES